MLRKLLLLAGILVAFGVPTSAQTITQVSATVTDPSGIPYSGATLTVLLNNPGGKSPTLTPCTGPPAQVGCPLPALGTVVTNVVGSFTIPLYANASILPAASTYTFQLAEPGNPTPLGTGPQTCILPAQTIAGGTQTLVFACPALSNVSAGLGPTSAVQTVVNVKAFGALGDTQSSNVGVVTTGNPDVNCANCTFTSADIGKTGNVMGGLGSGSFFAGNPTITTIVSATHVQMSIAAGGNITGFWLWGHIDDTAILNAATVFYAKLKNSVPQADNYLGPPVTTPPTLYFPAGNYQTCNIPSGLINPPASYGMQIIGDAVQESVISQCGNPTVPASGGILLNLFGNAAGALVRNLTFNASFSVDGPGTPTINVAGSANVIRDVVCSKSQQTCLNVAGSAEIIENFEGNSSFINVICQGCTQTEFYNSGASNGNSNLQVINALGTGNNGGVRFFGGFWDECGGPPCQRVVNSNDVWFIGTAIFGVTTSMSVDGTSYVHLSSVTCGPFGNDNNSGCLTLAAGGTVEASDTRFIGSGTGAPIANSGSLLDNGNNTTAQQFPVASGSSVTTTATLTASQNAPNAACAVGDTILVTGVNVAGYNGLFNAAVTAVGATTISYTTPGSGLGAATAGGYFYCQNILNFTGNLPQATLTHTWNTCNDTLATFTGGVLCNQFLDQPLDVFHVKASSQTATTCTVAPVVTLTDGTRTQTLTITTGKSSWDSAVDASTGLPAIPVKGSNDYKRGGTITVSVTTGTCAAPPTNFSVTYNAQSIFNN
jgi:hypothetical protein